MPRCSSARTMSRRDGARCSRSLMPGLGIHRGISRTMSRGAMGRLRPMNSWRAMAAPGDRWIEREELPMAKKRKISLVLADVDGTLVTEQKVLTERAQAAVKALQAAGVRFAITSGRPPLGMAMLFEPLALDTPIAAFNGGLFIARDRTILAQRTLPRDVARAALDLIRTHGLDAWVYRGSDW